MKDKNKKIITKKKVNLILSVRIIILYLVSNPVLFFIFFNWTILSCVKDKAFINESIIFEINVDNIIWGSWYKKLNSPFLHKFYALYYH